VFETKAAEEDFTWFAVCILLPDAEFNVKLTNNFVYLKRKRIDKILGIKNTKQLETDSFYFFR